MKQVRRPFSGDDAANLGSIAHVDLCASDEIVLKGWSAMNTNDNFGLLRSTA
jgi:hypothetical protein